MKRLTALWPSCLLLLVACAPQVSPNADGDCLDDAEELALGTNPDSLDSDGDGLDDCEEIELGTDPTNDDTDGDGLADATEIDCVSDPLDEEEQCYACGWEHNNPGGLESEGAAEGDTISNLRLHDQCGEEIRLWDLAGEYHILFMTAAW